MRLASPGDAATNAIPVVTSFVLTAVDQSRMYGACIVWYEELPAEVAGMLFEDADPQAPAAVAAGSDDEDPSLEVHRSIPSVHAPEAICLLSRVAVFSALMECCRQLFRMRISNTGPVSEEELEALFTTRVPSFGCSSSFPLGNVRIPLITPKANELPHTMAGRDFLLLFQALDANNVIMLWALLLGEQKVLLQARQTHVLTMAAETLTALLFPFSWQHVYIPILPARLLDVLQAPVPFLIGIDEEVLSVAESQRIIPDDVVQVDLNTNALMCNSDLAARMHLPQKQFHKLYKAVAPFCRGPNMDAAGANVSSAFPMAPPPDADVALGHGDMTLAEMTDAIAMEATRKVKAAFLRFHVSMMANYQDLMIVPPSNIKVPAGTDFFDVRKWAMRFTFSGNYTDWLHMFASSQTFTQFLEQRLAPRDSPELEVCFFNESIDAKLMRSMKTKLFGKHMTPLLTTGEMPTAGYGGPLVPAHCRTVYNASMIAARPVQAQQQVALLLLLGSGIQQASSRPAGEFVSTLKDEFIRNLLWSRVNIGAALLPHVCPWRSAGNEYHQMLKRKCSIPYPGPSHLPVTQPRLHTREHLHTHEHVRVRVLCVACCVLRVAWCVLRGAWCVVRGACCVLCVVCCVLCVCCLLSVVCCMLSVACAVYVCSCVVWLAGCGLESIAIRETMLDLTMHMDTVYQQELHAQLRESLRTLAQSGGGGLPLCVVAHGFGSVIAHDFFSGLQSVKAKMADELLSPLERGQTLACMSTLGSPLPLLAHTAMFPTDGAAELSFRVPSPAILERWPHLRGGWSNLYHPRDCMGYGLQATYPRVMHEAECRRRHKGDQPVQNVYFADTVDSVAPLAQSMSCVWLAFRITLFPVPIPPWNQEMPLFIDPMLHNVAGKTPTARTPRPSGHLPRLRECGSDASSCRAPCRPREGGSEG